MFLSRNTTPDVDHPPCTDGSHGRENNTDRDKRDGATPGNELSFLDNAGEGFVDLFSRGWLLIALSVAADIIVSVDDRTSRRDR